MHPRPGAANQGMSAMLPRDRAQTSEEGILCNLEVTERMPDPRADLSSPAMAILAVLQATLRHNCKDFTYFLIY